MLQTLHGQLSGRMTDDKVTSPAESFTAIDVEFCPRENTNLTLELLPHFYQYWRDDQFRSGFFCIYC